MPAGYIIFDAREFAYGRLIKMKEEFMKITGVDNIWFTDDKRTGKEDLFRVGPIGKTERQRPRPPTLGRSSVRLPRK